MNAGEAAAYEIGAPNSSRFDEYHGTVAIPYFLYQTFLCHSIEVAKLSGIIKQRVTNVTLYRRDGADIGKAILTVKWKEATSRLDRIHVEGQGSIQWLSMLTLVTMVTWNQKVSSQLLSLQRMPLSAASDLEL